MTNTESGIAAFALLTFTAITPSLAADPYAPPPVPATADPYVPPPVQASVVHVGMPCPGGGHYVWEQGYVNKGQWQYHWACEL